MYPEADIPVVQVSLVATLNPSLHFRLGQALAPLRREGVLIVCSGQATHNMRAGFSGGRPQWAVDFDGWLRSVAADPSQHTVATVESWQTAPGADEAHPREEHLVPFFVALGASEQQSGQAVIEGWFAGHFSLSSFMWAS